MRIAKILSPEVVIAGLVGGNKEEVLKELCDKININGVSSEKLLAVIEERESLGSTGIGEGVAIPHGKIGKLEQIAIVFGRSQKGVEFESIDGRPAHLFFMLLAPDKNPGEHLKALARVSKMLKNIEFRNALLAAGNAEEIISLIEQEENKLEAAG
jgi:nitrogen PTS system EIIA component